jgi:ubiquinone/menaquinone biosynthesis C-methylase UbiE
MKDSPPPVCSYEGSDYQTSFWEQGNRSYEDQVEATALRKLLPAGGHLLLELGAGAGRNTPRYRGYENVVLLDYALTQLQQAKARLGDDPRYRYVVADIYHLPFVPGLFDGATMIRTLHHMADAPRALQEIAQVLQSQACFILEYPNKQNLKAILRYLLRRQNWSPFTSNPVEFAALNFDFHPRAIKNWLSQTGFQIESTLTVSHFRAGLLKRTIPLSWLVRLDTWLQGTGNWFQLTPSVFVRAKMTQTHPPAVPDTIFCCPVCKAFPLIEQEQSCQCPACGKDWPIENGIYIFRE